ncbi:MAG TPA: DUF4831 family protein [Bacteroidales bacterium]|nr:DUF4831 family protein [Bacteroidales bacterium]HPI31325.1 DUF4831 family protein [Bacteroidales bacterium]HQN15750.1 DUF4831 family protein [Bacteroidales bacterium]HQP16580.1 DUF4831 family protein [Bacteroidales bacterium]
MKTVRIVYALIALVFFTACSGTVINVTKVDSSRPPSKNSGFYYALPRTFIKVDVVVDKTEQIRGPYAEYAEKYLGLTNVIKTNATGYEVSEYKLSTFAEPDPQQFYFVMLKNACSSKIDKFRLYLDEAGVLFNTTAAPEKSIADNAVFISEEEGNVYPDIFKSYTDLNLFVKVDTIIEKVNVDSVMIEKMTFKRSLVEKTPEQRAKEAADYIIKVKENRFNLISGFQEVNYDKETFKYMNDELEKMENEYRKLFTGITFTKKISYSFIYLPQSGKPVDTVPLFRFSTLRGVLDITDVYGEIVSLSIKKYGNTDSLQVYQTKKDSLKVAQHGFYYRVPDYAEVNLFHSKGRNVSGKFLISQYGVLSSMPATIRRFATYPATGAIKNVGIKK